ncbi:MAG: hypothetical protein U0164_08985 [Gemmatimonadaceae bacterium]
MRGEDHHVAHVGRIHGGTHQVGAGPHFVGLLELVEHDTDRDPAGIHAAETGGRDERAGLECVTEGHAAHLEEEALRFLAQVRAHDAEGGAVGGHGAGAEVRVRPEDRHAAAGIDGRDLPDQPGRGHDAGAHLDAGIAPAREEEDVVVAVPLPVQRLCRHEPPLQLARQVQQAAQLLVLQLQGA